MSLVKIRRLRKRPNMGGSNRSSNSTGADIQHVVGYGWRNDRPVLHLFDGPSREIQGRFAVKRLGERRCIGWWDRETQTRNSCQSHIATQKAQCTECSRIEGFWQCMTCDGFACPPLNAAIHSYCRADHLLYLASFGSNDVKIGTTSAARGVARLVEQGPVAAVIIAKAPGPIIRQMETLGVQAGLVETFTRTQKFNAWRHAVSSQVALKQVCDTARVYGAALPDIYKTHLHTPMTVTLPKEIASTSSMANIPLEPLTRGVVVKGEVVNARGHIVILHDGAGKVAIDIATLKGQMVDLNPADGPAPIRQLGLF